MGLNLERRKDINIRYPLHFPGCLLERKILFRSWHEDDQIIRRIQSGNSKNRSSRHEKRVRRATSNDDDLSTLYYDILRLCTSNNFITIIIVELCTLSVRIFFPLFFFLSLSSSDAFHSTRNEKKKKKTLSLSRFFSSSLTTISSLKRRFSI